MPDSVSTGDVSQKQTPRPTALRVIFKNAVANLSRLGVNWLILLLLPPLLVRSLNQPAYASWMLILQLGAYVTILDGNILGAVGRFVARAEGRDDTAYIRQLMSSVAVLLLGSAAGLALLIAAFATQMQHFFPAIPPAVFPEARSAFLLVALSCAAALPFSVLAGYFFGIQRNEVLALAGTTGKLLGAAGTAWVAYRSANLVGMAGFTALGSLLPVLIYLAWWQRSGRSHVFNPRYFSASITREFVGFFFSAAIVMFGSILITGLDMPIVTAFAFWAAPFYAVASTLSNMLVVPLSSIVSTVMPIAAGISDDDLATRLGSALLRTSRYACAMLAILVFPLMAGMSLFLNLWVGPDYARQSFAIAEVLVLAQCIRISLLPYAVVVFSAGQQRQTLVSPLVEAALNVAFSVVLVHYLAGLGVAIGTLIGAIVGVALHFAVSMPRTNAIRFERGKLAWMGILRPLACALPGVFCFWVFRGVAHSAAMRAGLLVLCELLILATIWKVNFAASERAELFSLLRRRSRA